MLYADTKRTTVLRTTNKRAGPEVMVGTDVRILRVRSTHALRGRLSRGSEISSMGDWLGWGVVTRSFGLGCEDFTWVAVFIVLGNGACLGASVTLGADFVVLPVFLVFVTSLCLKATAVEPGVSCGSIAEIALTRRPPQSMWFQPGPRLTCYTEGLRLIRLRRHKTAGCAVALLCSTGTRCATFHLTQPRQLAV